MTNPVEITCETQGHLWSPRGVCVMCHKIKPAEQAPSKKKLRPRKTAELTQRDYINALCEYTGAWAPPHLFAPTIELTDILEALANAQDASRASGEPQPAASKEIVDRLRNSASIEHPCSPALARKAADEIERLQRDLYEAEKLIDVQQERITHEPPAARGLQSIGFEPRGLQHAMVACFDSIEHAQTARANFTAWATQPPRARDADLYEWVSGLVEALPPRAKDDEHIDSDYLAELYSRLSRISAEADRANLTKPPEQTEEETPCPKGEDGIHCECFSSMKTWRCFHCDDVFRTQVDARNHFGSTEASDPACLIKAPGEFALLQALRNAEDELSRYRSEDSDVLRAMWSAQADHATALRREEEKGYARGVRDARAEMEKQS